MLRCSVHNEQGLILRFLDPLSWSLLPVMELDVSYTLPFGSSCQACPTRVEKGERLRELNLTNSNANHTEDGNNK